MTRPKTLSVAPLGEAALAIRVTSDTAAAADAPADVTMLVRAIAAALRDAALPGVVDVVPSPERVTLVGDPLTSPGLESLMPRVTALAEAAATRAVPTVGERHEIAVDYGGEAGPDLDDVCAAHGIDRDTLVRLHTEPDYLVTAIGFVPGFPYLAGLPEPLVTPRRATPRTSVPAGSVGIGGGQTGIYPFATPGGWHIIGRTGARLFAADRTPPALLRVGDRVRFVAMPSAQPAVDASPSRGDRAATGRPDVAGAGVRPTTTCRLTILSPGLHTTVQDLGRPGYRDAGVPLGGAADPVALRVANLAVGNPPDAAALECTLVGPAIRFECDATIALAGAVFSGLPQGRPVHVAAGSVLALGHALRGCRGYLAVAGGIDVPAVLGSRSTYVPAALGGFHGRAIAADDALPIGAATTRTIGLDWCVAPDVTPLPASITALRCVPAEAAAAEAWQSAWRITASSDRMGVRLAGRPLAMPEAGVSVAVLPGTVQVPPDGQPIILLCDAQTIGGYPVLGQISAADLPLAAQLRPGDAVRLVPTTASESRAALRAREAALAAVRWSLAHRTTPVVGIDLNADVGEGAAHDDTIIPLVSSVNIACGGHAGDARSMRAAVALARKHGVAVGAHPGHRDPAHFGRRILPIEPAAAADLVAEQLTALAAIAGDALRHVKLHGALYHQVAHDAALAAAVTTRLARDWPRLVLVAPAGSLLASVARSHGLAVAEEAFVDRAYADDGSLVPRSAAGAVIHHPAAAAEQAVRIARDGRVATTGGGCVALRADTLCVHGDGPDPVACLLAVRHALRAAGFEVRSG